MIESIAANASQSSQGATMATGIFIRGNKLWIQRRIDGKLYRYSTGKENTPRNKKWVAFHFESLWEKLHHPKQERVLSQNESADNLTVAEYGRRYYQNVLPDTRDTKLHERMLYDFEKWVVPFLGDIPLKELRASHIEKWQTLIKYYPDDVPKMEEIDQVKPRRGISRVTNLRNTLTLILNDAVKNEIIVSSPAAHVPINKQGRMKKRTFTIEEIERLDEEELEDIYDEDGAVSYNEKDIASLMQGCDAIIQGKPKNFQFTWSVFKWHMYLKFYTGLRSGEAIALLWKYVDFERKQLSVRFTMRDGELKAPKGGKLRVIDMLPQAEHALRELQKLTGHSKWVILKHGRMEPFSNPFGPDRQWKQVIEQAGLKKARWYNTRHSFITNMLSRNMNPEWIIQQVGHMTINITRRHYEGRIEPEWEKLEGGALSFKVSQLVSHPGKVA
jgi:integrase